MLLEGSCHCRRVRFRLRSAHPCPFNLCYCSICRKTAGGGGYAINLGGDHETLEVEGRDFIKIYHARLGDAGPGEADSAEAEESPAERHFCGHCGSALWVWDPRWPALVHPFASAIDSPLPAPAGAHPPAAGLQGRLGAAQERSPGQAVRRLSGRIPRPVAPAPGSRGLRSPAWPDGVAPQEVPLELHASMTLAAGRQGRGLMQAFEVQPPAVPGLALEFE